MSSILRHLRSNVVAYVALFFAMGGTATAAVSLSASSVGNRELKSNAVTSSKVKNGSLIARDFRASSLPRGPQGPAGPAGATGATGAAGTSTAAGSAVLWAVVRASGSLVRSSGGVSVVRAGAGQYSVNFSRDVVNCAHIAQMSGFTIGGEVALPQAGEAGAGSATTGDAAGNQSVNVVTRGSSGDQADRTFNLAVFC